MSECIQDARWHAEGDVWTHTQRVLFELTKLPDWENLTDHERVLLKFTAILHDCAKPLTTEVDSITGHVTSPHHAAKGEILARSILRELECDLGTREAICKLVRYHGRPVFLLEREEPTHEIIRLSWLVNNKLLYLFALADSRGRDTDAMDRPEENLHYWKEVARELGCFESQYPFTTDHARFIFFRHAQPNVHYIPHENFLVPSRSYPDCREAGKITGSVNMAVSSPWSLWIPFAKRWMSTLPIIRVRSRRPLANAAVNICAAKHPLFLMRPIPCVPRADDGSIYSPTIMRG